MHKTVETSRTNLRILKAQLLQLLLITTMRDSHNFTVGMGNPSVCEYSPLIIMTTQLRTLIIAMLPHNIGNKS